MKVKTRIWSGTFLQVNIVNDEFCDAGCYICFYYHMFSGVADREVYAEPVTVFIRVFVSCQATYQTVELTSTVDVETSNPDLLVIDYKQLPVRSRLIFFKSGASHEETKFMILSTFRL